MVVACCMREFLLLSLLIPKKDEVSPVKVLSPNWKTSESKFPYKKNCAIM